MHTEPTADEIIDALGGTSETARIFNIKPASVTGWREHGIPEARLMYLRAVHPDLFLKPAAQASAADPQVTQ